MSAKEKMYRVDFSESGSGAERWDVHAESEDAAVEKAVELAVEDSSVGAAGRDSYAASLRDCARVTELRHWE